MRPAPFSPSPKPARAASKKKRAPVRAGSASLPVAHPGLKPGSPRKGRLHKQYFRSPTGDVVQVRRGFSWKAFFVGSTVAFLRRLWPLLVAVVLALFGHAYFEGVKTPSTAALGIAAVSAVFYAAYMLFCGFNGNRWIAQSLRRRGYIVVGEE